MSLKFEKRHTVSNNDVDINRHVNNVRYVQWMQDVAVEHSRHVGCDHDVYVALGASWVARSHRIDYATPAFLNDAIKISTWIDRFRKVSCFRKYEFRRESDDSILASAETEWVYVSLASGRPCKIHQEVIEKFG